MAEMEASLSDFQFAVIAPLVMEATEIVEQQGLHIGFASIDIIDSGISALVKTPTKMTPGRVYIIQGISSAICSNFMQLVTEATDIYDESTGLELESGLDEPDKVAKEEQVLFYLHQRLIEQSA